MIKFNRKATGPRLLWEPVKELPSLRGAKLIAVDCETRDDGITEKRGPGGVLGMGHILGISIATNDGWSGYIPLRHPDSSELNWAPEKIKRWAAGELTRKSQPKVGANILYDLEWLRAEGIPIDGPYRDVQHAAALLNESRGTYRLASLSEEYVEEKFRKATGDQTLLATEYLGEFKGDVRGQLYKLPARLVGGYGEMDAVTTLKVFQKQLRLLEKEELMTVFDIECRLIPLLLDMRFRGVRVDLDKAVVVDKELVRHIKAGHAKIRKLAGFDVGTKNASDIAKACDKLGITYPRTPKTRAPSFVKEWMEAHPHVFIREVQRVRGLETTKSNFLDGCIFGNQKDGVIHCQFNQLRSDDYGTVTGRFSSSNPNLQQVPSREDTNAALIRSLFIPFKGQDWWGIDWSQMEYRLIVHFAYRRKLPKAAEARDQYHKDPKTDYHEWVANLLSKPRKDAKNLNFGLAYAMGIPLLARKLGLSIPETKDLFELYHFHNPYVQGLSRDVSAVARSRGYIRTILGRRRRFNLYEPVNIYGKEGRQLALRYEAAVMAYGPNICRAYTYRAMNSLIQGSNADIMKKSMVDAYESGVFGPLGGVASLTVHDELDGSKNRGRKADQALRELVHIMETCVPLEVPVIAECVTGTDWWNGKEFK